jgi:cbb3-type cytochrome oxidase maturation protein
MTTPWFFFLLCLAMGLAAWTVFWWTVRSGQLKDPEAVAAEMLVQDALDGTERIESSARLQELAGLRAQALSGPTKAGS